MRESISLVLGWAALVLRGFAADEPPREWIDPDTGHRVIRISTEPGSASLYFHQNTYTPEGDKMIFNTPRSIAVVDLATLGLQPSKVDIVVTGASAIATARKSRGCISAELGRCWRRIWTHARCAKSQRPVGKQSIATKLSS